MCPKEETNDGDDEYQEFSLFNCLPFERESRRAEWKLVTRDLATFCNYVPYIYFYRIS